MHIIIFAGGAGTRLWPLSRRNTPKQFEKLKGNRSTLQMAVERVRDFGWENLFVATNEQYRDLVQAQVPEVSIEHIFSEPAKRDLGAAVGLALLRLKKQGAHGTVAILWADHFMDNPDQFVVALRQGEELIAQNPERFVFLGEKARFANHNLGWIKLGQAIEQNVYTFAAWKYRPELPECQQMFASHEWVWNPGYFIFDIDFVLGLYAAHQPEMFAALEKMVADETTLATEYAKLPALSFDNAIVEKISPAQAVVLKVNLGWCDPGTLYALKEALVPDTTKNYEHGRVLALDSVDCLLYNGEPKKILTTIGLEGMVVVNTPDAILVCHKDKVPEIKTLLAEMEKQGQSDYL